ncbi:hypothetical protein [Rathayibacter rathayi]|uniref:hypothetical protein n=1 Tax=Rathayibacter rathayi TaxID=33887 RepID=UPI001F35E0CF|nr:hypothetical protein [Rathayibacter rathayi]
MTRALDVSPRLADALVTVLGADGVALAHADVSIEQRRHAFTFGCTPPSTDPARAKERRLWLDLFDTAILPVYWGRFEPERGRTSTEAVLAEARARRRRRPVDGASAGLALRHTEVARRAAAGGSRATPSRAKQPRSGGTSPDSSRRGTRSTRW